jgi:hypothetical protein
VAYDTGVDWPGALSGGGLGAWGVSDYRDPDSYWRRRFLILAGGLVVLGAMAWGLSTLLGPAKPIAGSGPGAAAPALPAQDTLPPAAYGLPYGATASRAAPAGQPGNAAAGGGPSTRGSAGPPGPTAHSAPGKGTAAAAAPAACSPGSIVLSLFTGQARYGPGQQPQFEVYAVSTAPGACDLAYGPSVVHVMVTSQSRVVWDSAACNGRAAAPAASPVRFTRGVPRVAIVSWNRQAGTAGCGGSVPAGVTGTFSVVATADGQSSPVRTFTLAG